MRRILALTLAFLMLALSFRVGVAVHLCGGKLVQTKWVIGYGKAGCGMDEQNDRCEKQSSAVLNKPPCCVNGLQQIASDDYQSAGKLIQYFFGYNVEFIQANIVSSGHDNEVERLIFYRPPPGLSAVFLPFIRVFLI
ncbi:MAG: hypothetical protein Q8M15_00780 [Bacteroidota bacterium]|nr:hypothetical protein [Bacteroidota bacterium]